MHRQHGNFAIMPMIMIIMIVNEHFQQVAPDANMYEMTKQQERQQWLKDLGE